MKLPSRYFDVGSYFGLRSPLAVPFTLGEFVLAFIIGTIILWGVVTYQDVLTETNPDLPLQIIILAYAVEFGILFLIWAIRIVRVSAKK
jgi:hypothetical protein